MIQSQSTTDHDDAEGPAELLILAVPRTGTNYLCATLSKFQKSVALYELFHPGGAYGLRTRDYLIARFSSLLGRPILDVQDKAIVQHVRANPTATLATISACCAEAGERLVSYKIFPDHLPDETLSRMLDLRRPKVLFVVRDRLPTFVSMKKADASGVWVNHDTTALTVEAHLDEFLSWSADCDRWYAKTQAMVRAAGLQHLVLGYERHIDAPEAKLVTTLADALATLGIRVGEASQFVKQDRTENVFDRIANGAEFQRQLRHVDRLDYAITSPLAGEQWPGR